MLGACVVGALIAGGYGVIHDQVTYTLAPEYFTKFKFAQFGYLNSAEPERALVGKIGFQATWWVGMIAAWALFRMAPYTEGDRRGPLFRKVVRQFWLIIAIAILFGVAGYLYGSWRTAEGVPTWWLHWREQNDVEDLAAFARVGYVHNFGYLGALAGLVVAVMRLRRERAPKVERSEDIA